MAKAIERWPIITAIGASILAVTGAGMVVKDPVFDAYVFDHAVADRVLQAVIAATIFLMGWRALRRGARPIEADAS